jgi:hypothetical protein
LINTLGSVSLESGRGEIDGLRVEFANEHEGQIYPVRHLDFTKVADLPDHSVGAVALRLGGGRMDGFVASFA